MIFLFMLSLFLYVNGQHVTCVSPIITLLTLSVGNLSYKPVIVPDILSTVSLLLAPSVRLFQ